MTCELCYFVLNTSTNASVNSSIAHPPPGNPRAFALFFSLSWQFPGVGQEKRGNAPPPGKKKMTNARPQGTLTHL
jgi:hypothetical protein